MRDECERDPEFAEAVEQAKQQKIGHLEDLAFELAKCDGATLRWLLANLAPDQYQHKPELQTHVHAHGHFIATTDPEALRSRLAELAVEIGTEDVVDAVRIEQANGHHESNGHSGGADKA